MGRSASLMMLVLSVSACSSPESPHAGALGNAYGPLMAPGQNCLRCHTEGSGANAPPWTVGGTVFASRDASTDDGVEGVTVVVRDGTGKELRLVTNSAGNFYSRDTLTFPARVRIERGNTTIEMPRDVPAGSCNACHSHPDPAGGARGRIYIPSVGPDASTGTSSLRSRSSVTPGPS